MFWARLCDVDPGALQDYISSPHPWPQHEDRTKPRRLFDVPSQLTQPILAVVLPRFGRPVKVSFIVLSQVIAGAWHGMHTDQEPGQFLTRVHVPVTTNPGCWFEWELEPGRVQFPLGGAYSFNTQERHAFGNDGNTDRVHLTFDVWRA